MQKINDQFNQSFWCLSHKHWYQCKAWRLLRMELANSGLYQSDKWLVEHFIVLLEINSQWKGKFSFVKWPAGETILEGEGTANYLEKLRKMNLGMTLKALKNG